MLEGHCCLEKGTKTKTVTDVPIQTLDGWLNGQTGIWWLGALKEGHRTMWDGHVVMSWAMVFIPAYPEVRNSLIAKLLGLGSYRPDVHHFDDREAIDFQ